MLNTFSGFPASADYAIAQGIQTVSKPREQPPRSGIRDFCPDDTSREGVEPDDLLCSRNAQPQKGETGSLVVLLLAERARSEGARSTRAFEDRPARPVKR